MRVKCAATDVDFKVYFWEAFVLLDHWTAFAWHQAGSESNAAKADQEKADQEKADQEKAAQQKADQEKAAKEAEEVGLLSLTYIVRGMPVSLSYIVYVVALPYIACSGVCCWNYV